MRKIVLIGAALAAAALPLTADVSGFDPAIDDDFWNTTGRIDVPANARASAAAAGTFSSWTCTFRAASAYGVQFEPATSTERASAAYDRPFWTLPAGFYIIVK